MMYRELYNTTTTKIMILGDGCSISTEPTAQASHHWNIIQLSYSASSPALSDREIYPRLFRMFPPETVFNVIKFAVFELFNWRKVVTLHQSVYLFSKAMVDLQEKAAEHNISIIAAESFLGDPEAQVENIEKTGARIIIGGFYSEMARKVFCKAYHLKMYGAKYVWILPGWYNPLWWRVPDDSIDCTIEQMDEATAYHFAVFIDALPPRGSRGPSITGLTSETFLSKFHEIAGENPEALVGYTEISLGYDSVWAAALALEEADRRLGNLDPPKTLSDFDYNDNVTIDIMFDIFDKMMFEGVSGPVQFNEYGDRVCLLVLQQIKDGIPVRVGLVDPTVGDGKILITEGYEEIHWPGGKPPIDLIIEQEDYQTISLGVFLTGTIFAVFGIILACCFLAFNIHFRKLRVIKMSSPNINNLMLIGGILAYVSIIFLGIDMAIAPKDTLAWMCKANTWLLTIGFSMAFGSLFSKTWRVHKIFTNKTAMKTVVKDYWLLSCVASLVAIDIIILFLWDIVDPLEVVEKIGVKVLDSENDDLLHIPVRNLCESKNQIYWIGALYVIDGLLMIFGAFLAWETRKVTIPALNDSKYIGICVYNVLILSFIGAPVSFVLEERNAHYAIVASIVWLATTFTLCVVFVPKIKMRNDVRPAQNTSVLTVDRPGRNTVDTQKELQLLRMEIRRMKNECKCLAKNGSTNPVVVNNGPSGNAVTEVTGTSPASGSPENSAPSSHH
ncbi:gamma-aminobutyric acid type B receptor subunit 1-like [Asterias rubens]|uniref:gamma-aminobutyric acid type B receptor subunit 1-like n=1 Tax=Asterias rubens TaxID=7604 RepID=UPI001455D89A|nr:gamma-aminobutyric acid type B receptor subunit 1-like [Asterias rubens]